MYVSMSIGQENIQSVRKNNMSYYFDSILLRILKYKEKIWGAAKYISSVIYTNYVRECNSFDGQYLEQVIGMFYSGQIE